jgi:hypothetical protein
MNYGLLLGLVLVILSLLVFVFEMYEASWLSIVSYLILIGGLIVGIKRRRDLECGGYISFGSALGYGTLIGLFVGLVGAIVLYLYLGFVDDGFITYNIEKQEMQFYESGMTDAQIEQSMSWTKKFSTPFTYAIAGIITNVFSAFIISLIAAAFLKKEPENFEDTE